MKIDNRIIMQVLLLLPCYPIYSIIPISTFASGTDSSSDSDSDLCSDLVRYFGKIRDVMNLENSSTEQIQAIGSLRVFLVEKFGCIDEFDDFEWD